MKQLSITAGGRAGRDTDRLSLASRTGGCPMRPLNQFEEYLVNEFVDDYNDGVMTRRDMVSRVLYITGGVASAATMLTTLGVRAADAMVPSKLLQATPTAKSPESVPPDDPAVVARDVTY